MLHPVLLRLKEGPASTRVLPLQRSTSASLGSARIGFQHRGPRPPSASGPDPKTRLGSRDPNHRTPRLVARGHLDSASRLQCASTLLRGPPTSLSTPPAFSASGSQSRRERGCAKT